MSSIQNVNSLSPANALEISELHVQFDTPRGVVRALRGVELALVRGKTTGIAGETGCGKSVTALSILRLVLPPGRITRGRISLHGQDLLTLPETGMKCLRGSEIAMIFQNPRAALNPLFTVGQQLHFILRRHTKSTAKESREKGVELLRKVGIADPGRRISAYPHELSTGMCQRVGIALALSCTPRLLLADEPTTGLDVTIEAQILTLFRELVADLGSTAMIITHDLGVISETCDYVAVMYAGRVAEYGTTRQVFDNPKHPYTRGLLSSFLVMSESSGSGSAGFSYIKGTVPSLIAPIDGCAFAPRCENVREICRTAQAPRCALSDGRTVECHLYAQQTSVGGTAQ